MDSLIKKGGGKVDEPKYKHNGAFGSYITSLEAQIDMGSDLKCRVRHYAYSNNGGSNYLQAKKNGGSSWVTISSGTQSVAYRYFRSYITGADNAFAMCSVSAVALVNQK